MKISVAEARRRLAVGKKIVAQYLRGDCHTSGERLILKQTSTQMISQCLDGEKQGHNVFCYWEGCTADLSETGQITVSKEGLGSFVQFKIVD